MLFDVTSHIYINYKNFYTSIPGFAEQKKSIAVAALQRLYSKSTFIEKNTSKNNNFVYWEISCISCPINTHAISIDLTDASVIKQDSQDISTEPTQKVSFQTQDDTGILYTWTLTITQKSPLLVKSGDRVHVLYQDKGIQIQGSGQAMESGHKGDLVDVRMDAVSSEDKTQSKNIFTGKVSNFSEVMYASDF